ncbi:hypothetical protein JJJ17_01295 [Paracoccus caeni]|uniref:DUF2946 domain-containing protein n=1 Tax=Paracoccus caeni TaxID=657651 RepID=A0A934SBA1_9RHOB|nr:hypothetical protein [Paracoccus caeni]MBK4214553.1 hypothetical protein [Paracoccus caeni]
MRNFLHIPLFGTFLIAVLALAFATGMHARPLPTEMETRLEASLLAGFSINDFCLSDKDSHEKSTHCSLCYLITASHLPRIDRLEINAEQRVFATIVLPQIQRAAAHPRDPTTSKRGPPQTA